MTDTYQLIDRLAAGATPVRPIRPPLQRLLLWLAIAAVLVGLMLALVGLRPDVEQAVRDPLAVAEWLLSVAVALTAGYAVFEVSVPGRSARWAWLSVPPFVAWLGLLSWGCVAQLGTPAGARIGSAECAAAIALTAIPIALVTLLMVRFARVTRPVLAALLAALAASMLSAAATSLHHSGETGLTILVWHGGAVLALTMLCALLGRPLFAWLGAPRG